MRGTEKLGSHLNGLALPLDTATPRTRDNLMRPLRDPEHHHETQPSCLPRLTLVKPF